MPTKIIVHMCGAGVILLSLSQILNAGTIQVLEGFIGIFMWVRRIDQNLKFDLNYFERLWLRR